MKIGVIKCDNCTCELNGILISTHRHDFVSCDNGHMIDGGFDYTRHYAEDEVEYVGMEEIFPVLRERIKWTSIIDKDNNYLEKPITRKLSEMDDSHIKKLIELGMTGTRTPIFEYELKHRNEISTRQMG